MSIGMLIFILIGAGGSWLLSAIILKGTGKLLCLALDIVGSLFKREEK